MRKHSKITKRMLMNYYGNEMFEMCKNVSREDAFRWLTQANQFLNKLIGVDKRLANEEKMRKLGW